MNLPEPQLPRGPIVLSFREQIAARHEQAKSVDQKLRELFLLKLNAVRECGAVLEHAKSTLHESEFIRATDFLDREAVRSYLKFSKKHEEPITDLQAGLRSAATAMQSTGLLPFTHGHGEQHLHQPNFFSAACSLIQRFSAEFTRFARARPLKNWRLDQVEAFAADLQPLARIIEAVNVALRHKENARQ